MKKRICRFSMAVFVFALIFAGCDAISEFLGMGGGEEDKPQPGTAASVKTVDDPDLTGRVPRPVTGGVPVKAVSAPEYSGVVAWMRKDGEAWTDYTRNAFDPDVQYQAVVRLVAASGYTFEGEAANFFTHSGGEKSAEPNPFNAAGSGTVIVTFPPTTAGEAAFPAGDLDLSGKIAAPVPGAVPAVSLSAAEYSGFAEWSLNGVPLDGPFGMGSYTAEITLTATSGRTFKGITDLHFTFDGADSVDTVDNGDGTVTVTIVFPMIVTLIADVDLTGLVPAPAIGGTPVTEFSGGNYSGTVAWKAGSVPMAPGFFTAGQSYTAVAALSARAGYYFAEGLTVTHGGIAGSWDAAAGTATIVFPATAGSIVNTFAEAVSAIAAAPRGPGTSQSVMLVAGTENYAAGTTLSSGNSPAEVVIDGGGRTVTLSSNGSLLTVGSGVTLTLRNITLRGKQENENGLIVYVQGGGKLFLEDGAILTGNQKIYDSGPDSGNGVYVASGGAITMNGGEISGNSLTSFSFYVVGAGVHIASGGTFTMNGGKISGNTVGAGGGVYVAGAFTMNDGEISGNTVLVSGGGVVIGSGGVFTMNGGEISGNTAHDGGGVRLYDASFTMIGGVISGNTADDWGGGVTIDANGAFTMRGGVISGNTAKNYGGGVYVNTNGTFTKQPPADGGTSSGIIYGYDPADHANSNAVGTRDGNGKITPTNGKGHAVCVKKGAKRRESTAGETQSLNSETADGWE